MPPLLTDERSIAASVCNVSLALRKSKAACILDDSFGCVNATFMFVSKGCRGSFLCRGNEIACGYGGMQQDNCTCNEPARNVTLHVQVGACCRHLPELQPRPPIKARTPEACGAACMDTAGCNYVDHHHTYKACILCSACRRESPRIVSKGYTSWRKITAFTAPRDHRLGVRSCSVMLYQKKRQKKPLNPACVQNYSFGCEVRHFLPRVWVDHGCAGTFMLGDGQHGEHDQWIDCGSSSSSTRVLCPPLLESADDSRPTLVHSPVCGDPWTAPMTDVQPTRYRSRAEGQLAVALVLSGAFSHPQRRFDASDAMRASSGASGDAEWLCRQYRLVANLTGRSIVEHVVRVNDADVFIFSWTPELRGLYWQLFGPWLQAAQFENISTMQPMFEQTCRRPDRQRCHWRSVSWAYAVKRGMQLVERHERHVGRLYGLVVFYRTDVLLVRSLNASAIVRQSATVYHTEWMHRQWYSSNVNCGDHHFVMAREHATQFAGIYDAIAGPLPCALGGCPAHNDTQCFKHAYIRDRLQLDTALSGIRTFRDEDLFRLWMRNLCEHSHRTYVPNATFAELRALGFNESHADFYRQAATEALAARGRPFEGYQWCLPRLGFEHLLKRWRGPVRVV